MALWFTPATEPFHLAKKFLKMGSHTCYLLTQCLVYLPCPIFCCLKLQQKSPATRGHGVKHVHVT